MSIDLAIKVAQSNQSYSRWPMSCILKKGGAVQAIGWNVLKSNPLYLDNHCNCSIHAEVAALRTMKYKAKGCTAYVARIMRSGSTGLAKPCPNCSILLYDAGIKRVYFTTNTHEIGFMSAKELGA